MQKFKISNKIISENEPVFIVAELSANHVQNFDLAVKTIKSMKDSGADAVKFQTYTADTLTIDCDNKYFTINSNSLWDGKNFYELYKSSYMPWEWHEKLKNIALEIGLDWFSTPTDFTSVDFLEKLNVPAYKITSFEITNIPLIKYIAEKAKPVIFSTGIAELNDIKTVIDILREKNISDIAVLKCVSDYPAKINDMNLKVIPDLIKRFNVIAGLSDHSLSNEVPISAVSLGARIIEKHFILDKSLNSPDAKFSLEPNEFKSMVNSIRNVEAALGSISYNLTESMKKNKDFSCSIFVVNDIKKNEFFTNQNIRVIRPGFGMHPKYYEEIIGKKAKKLLIRGTPLNQEHIL